MAKHNDGGPAYPQHSQSYRMTFPYEGMTLWDAAALAALQGLCGRIDDIKKEKLAEGIVGGRFEVQAAMQIADKFIAERAKRMGAGDD